MQVVAVEETRNGSLFSREFLLEAFCSPQLAARAVVASFLEQSLHLIIAQDESRSGSRRVRVSFSRQAMNRLAQENHQRPRLIQG